MWYAEGELSDPATGKVYAQVCGVEASRSLESGSPTEAVRAVAKYYAYEGSQAPKQNATVVSFAGVITQALKKDSDEVVSTANFDNGRCVTAAKSKFSAQKTSSRIDTYLTPEGRPEENAQQKIVSFDARAQKSPALSRAQRGLRCRESYVLDDNGQLAYSRFGECPAWVGAGKLCALDLTMTKDSRRGGKPTSFLQRLRPRHTPPSSDDALMGNLEAQARLRLATVLDSTNNGVHQPKG